MCGLFGEIGAHALHDPDLIARIAGTIQHRGPDDGGSAVGAGWMLGFRRLSILDLSAAGHQPFHSPDGRYVMVFNGEVYNYVELRAELVAQGEQFRTGTDTEVVLRLMALEGPSGLQRLNGMYAFVIVDTVARRFLIARDRLGVKPLHYRLERGRLRFASELKALLAWPGAPRQVNREALLDYLAMGYVPNDACIFDGYEKLAPGHYLEGDIDAPNAVARRYWNVAIEPQALSPEEDERCLDELEALLADAVSLRMRSDVPVALLLSGGIDSALVAALLAQGGKAPQALTAGFEGSDLDETTLARATAQHLGLSLYELPMSPGNLGDVDRLAATFDEPFADPSAIPMMKICEAARLKATVLLSGDGGDEAFAGYRRYLEVQRYRHLLAVPDRVRELAWSAAGDRLSPRRQYQLAKATLAGDLVAPVFDGLGLLRDPAVRAVLPEDLAAIAGDVPEVVARIWSASRGKDILSRQRQYDYGVYLPDDVLVKTDRASMAHSTELRSPFLDYRVVEFAAKLPNRLLQGNGEGKLILRRLARRHLPPEVYLGKKKGFGVPLGDWLRQPAGEALVRERLLQGGRWSGELWRPEGAAQALSTHLAGRRDMSGILWSLLVLEAWSRVYLDGAASTLEPSLMARAS